MRTVDGNLGWIGSKRWPTDHMVEKLRLEGDKEISWGGACRKVEVFTKEIGSKDMSKVLKQSD